MQNRADGRLDRRGFMAMVGASLAGRAATPRAAGPYRLAVETYCFHDVDLAATLRHTRDLGLRVLELHDGHLPRDASPERLAEARAALRAAGIVAEGVYIHDAFTDSEAVARPIFEFARTMGFSYINGAPKREALPLLNRLSPTYGVQIAIHNHGPGARYETLEHVIAALDAHPNLVACVDIGHFARSRVDPVKAISAIGRRAIAVHVKDVNPAGENIVLGEGIIDVRGVFTALRQVGFTGLLVLEYEGDFDNMGARLVGMRRSLDALRKLIGAVG